MGYDICIAFMHVANLFLFLSFLYFLTRSGRKTFPINLKMVFNYQIIAIVTNLIDIVSRYFLYQKISLIILLIFTGYHLVFWIYFILSALKKMEIYKFKRLVIFFSLAISSIFIAFDLINNSYYLGSLSNILVFLFCILYYCFIFYKTPDGEDGFQSNNNLIINGVFISSIIIFPLLLFGKHLKVILSENDFYYIALFAPISSIVLYCYFTAAIFRHSKNIL